MALDQAAQGAQPQSGRRLVVFVGGFDPRGARHYHQLMRREAVKQSAVSEQDYSVGSRSPWSPAHKAGLPHAAWEVSTGTDAKSDYVFMEWSDIVRAHWPQRTWQVIGAALKTYALVLRELACLKPLHQATPYTLWTLAYPLAYMLLCVLLSCLGLWGGLMMLPGVWGVAAGVLAAGLILVLGYKLDRLLHVSWLLRILNFARQASEQSLEELEQRMDATAQVLAEQMQQTDCREVVVVGFSVGSAVAVGLVHALRQKLLQRAQGIPAQGIPVQTMQDVHLLTLGNCIPLFTLMPGAQTLRSQLFALAQDKQLHWVDISSPSDSVSFGMCDLLALSLPDVHGGQPADCVNPRLMCTPRFHKLFRPATYRWLRRNKMRMHFQYLMASELPGAYDYFALLTCRDSLMDFIFKRLVR